ncbi:MAG: response regulator [Vicinamibacterales bacterium]
MAISARPLVLVVEDDLGIRDLLEKFLRLQGFETCSADSASAALDVFRARHPSAAVVDLRLREGTGSEVVASIPSAIPVIIYSGAPSESSGLEQFRPNTLLIAKPFSLTMLGETLRKMMRARPARNTDGDAS